MKRVCAWCNEVIRECVPGTKGDDRQTDGMCESCRDKKVIRREK